MISGAAPDRLAALERRGDELEAFQDCRRQANEWLRDHSTDELVAELRSARDARRRMKVGTINVLLLLEHIDRLESLVAGDPVVRP